MESRNVTFLETPAYSLPLGVTSEDHHYEGDVLRFTSALDGPSMTEDTFDGKDFCSGMEQETRMKRLRQEVRRLNMMNATYRELPTSPQHLSASPGVASDNSGIASPSTVPGTTGEPEDASPGAALSAPTTPAAGNAPTASRTGRRLEVPRARTRNSPNDEDTVDSSEVPRALLLAHTLRPDPDALTFSQLLEIAGKASGFVIETETADFAHLDGDPFASSRAFVYATGAPAHKGISEEGNQPLEIPNSYEDAGKSSHLEGLARRHSEGDGQLGATRPLQTGQHLQRPKGGEDHRLTLRLQAEGRRVIQGQTRRSRPRPSTWDRLREELCTRVPHRKHTDPTGHRMRARMAFVADGCGGGIFAVPHRQGRRRGASTGT